MERSVIIGRLWTACRGESDGFSIAFPRKFTPSSTVDADTIQKSIWWITFKRFVMKCAKVAGVIAEAIEGCVWRMKKKKQ